MSTFHAVLLAALAAGAVSIPAQAQSPGAGKNSPAATLPGASQTGAVDVPADSVLADTAPAPAPAKKGGLFGRVKKIAANKAVQGVAKGVACNAVPGAAAVSAATGKGGCPAGLGVGGMPGGGVTGALGGAVGGAIGAKANAAATGGMIPNGGAMPSMAGMMSGAGAMAGMSNMSALTSGTGMPPGVKLNEPAAAKCLGLTVQELRDVMNPTPEAAQVKRAEAVREKMMRRAQQGAQPTDMQACASAWQGVP